MGYTLRTEDDPGDVGRSADQNESVENDIFFKAMLTYVELEVFSFAYETGCTMGDGYAYLIIPETLDGYSLVGIHGKVKTAGTTGTMDIMVHNVTAAVDMLSTIMTIDSGELGSDTAAAPAVIQSNGDEEVAAYDTLRIDVDAVHTTPAEGLIVTLRFG